MTAQALLFDNCSRKAHFVSAIAHIKTGNLDKAYDDLLEAHANCPMELTIERKKIKSLLEKVSKKDTLDINP